MLWTLESLWSKWDDYRCIGPWGQMVLEFRKIIRHKYDILCNSARGPGAVSPKQYAGSGSCGETEYLPPREQDSYNDSLSHQVLQPNDFAENLWTNWFSEPVGFWNCGKGMMALANSLVQVKGLRKFQGLWEDSRGWTHTSLKGGGHSLACPRAWPGAISEYLCP